MAEGITTTDSGRAKVATHAARKAIVAAAQAPYDSQDAKAFKCPTCKAPSGESCVKQ